MNIVNIAASGARANQAHLNTVAMNLANLNTRGYSRQRNETSAVGPSANTGLSVGNGVNIDSIRRIADQFLISQEWQANSGSNYYSTSAQHLGSLEYIVSKEETSLSIGLDKFFSALNGSTARPDSVPLRTAIIEEAKSMALRFNNFNQAINEQKVVLADQRTAVAVHINTLSANIAIFNQRITELEANGGSSNILRDERDNSVKELSGLIAIRVNYAADGSYDISLKQGQPLVNGNTAGTIKLNALTSGIQEIQLEYVGATFDIDQSTGGKLGALNDLQNQTLVPMQEKMQAVAQKIAEEFNTQLTVAYDLNGVNGINLFDFNVANPKGMLQVTNISPVQLALSTDATATGDGGNLLNLIALKSKTLNIHGMGNTNIHDAASSIITELGVKTREFKTEALAANNVLTEAAKRREGVSGVNKEEEGENLINYKSAYEANLKVMAIGDQLFENLLAIF